MKDLTSMRNLAIDAARLAGDLLKSERSEKVFSNIGKDIKLETDLQAHKVIVGYLEKHSKIPVLSEEDEVHDFSVGTKWVVDPLDGSFNYLRNLPASAVSIALMVDGNPMLGVVYDFNREELFVGLVGEGATLNDQPIIVSKTSDINDGALMTGFPSHTSHDDASLKSYIGRVQTFKKIRLIGSAALSLAYVACGRADAYYEKDIKIWDVAAGLALARAAGGNYDLSRIDTQGGCTVSATNGSIPLSHLS